MQLYSSKYARYQSLKNNKKSEKLVNEINIQIRKGKTSLTVDYLYNEYSILKELRDKGYDLSDLQEYNKYTIKW